MSGHTPWSDIKSRRQPHPQDALRSAQVDRAVDIALTLAELRKHRGATQVDLASAMGRDQGTVSRTERQDDLFLSTLRGYVEALGGHLEIRAVFDDQVVEIVPVRDAITI